MFVVGESTISEILAETELSLEIVIAEIKHLGLRLSPQKTEIIVFGASAEDVVDLTVPVMGASVKVNQSFKYLGLVVDNKWNFKEHFRVLLPKAEKMAAVLSRLMPMCAARASDKGACMPKLFIRSLCVRLTCLGVGGDPR